MISSKILVSWLLLAVLVASSLADGQKTDSKCDSVECYYGARCEESHGEAKCVCPSVCPAIYDPVCGSDNKTYGNECLLNVAQCNQQQTITVKSKGPCPE